MITYTVTLATLTRYGFYYLTDVHLTYIRYEKILYSLGINK
jgi:hypothetical protein